MNLSGRERKLLIALGVVVLLMAVWFLFLRPSSEPVVLPDDLFASPTPSVVVSPGAEGTGAGGTVSPSFVIPADARDPFRS